MHLHVPVLLKKEEPTQEKYSQQLSPDQTLHATPSPRQPNKSVSTKAIELSNSKPNNNFFIDTISISTKTQAPRNKNFGACINSYCNTSLAERERERVNSLPIKFSNTRFYRFQI